MKAIFGKRLAGALLALGLLAGAPAAVDQQKNADIAAVKAFYQGLLSNPLGENLGERVRAVVIEEWVSVPEPRGGPGAAGLAKTLHGFGKMIPDLKWSIQEILQDGDRYIVRSSATCRPQSKIFGIEPKVGFEIMTIDMYTLSNGKIVRSYHVEDWARAKRQIAGGAEKH